MSLTLLDLRTSNLMSKSSASYVSDISSTGTCSVDHTHEIQDPLLDLMFGLEGWT